MAMATVGLGKIDLKKQLAQLYSPARGEFVEVRVPPMDFLMVDGCGDPNTATDYASALQWLYGLSYAMKFAARKVVGKDYVVPPLEGLWWADDPASFVARRKSEWKWTMMILVPDFVPRSLFDEALTKLEAKLGERPASLRLARHDEGVSLQTLHVGSYDDEGPALARLHHEVMPRRAVTFNGPHHEIYLSDPRKTAAAKLKTVLRQPVKPV